MVFKVDNAGFRGGFRRNNNIGLEVERLVFPAGKKRSFLEARGGRPTEKKADKQNRKEKYA
jgi:hypothetical protein